MFVGHAAKQPAANRAHQKASSKHACGVEQLHGRIIGRKESRCKVDRAKRVDIEVEPLDEIPR
ncbi:hypothetical protein NCPPB2254_04253 [Pseudomonas syringae pv. persicae]|uniref:Uncharacterized protein n=1 Tax=Pseudomonas syringae pv. persicae TaxID=237306 RepID=A0AB38EIN8_9PSED|nr:hypothetical protein NCPPB2254_04253 [Pseudomonas syringae pv. persicae]